MEMEFSEIIHRCKCLPTETNYVLYTIDDNQKIVEINLYTYKDEGVKEKVCSGYLVISGHLPRHSKLAFTFRLDEYEVLYSWVHIGAINKTRDLIIGRGNLNQHCLQKILNSLNVVRSSNTSNLRKATFTRKSKKS